MGEAKAAECNEVQLIVVNPKTVFICWYSNVGTHSLVFKSGPNGTGPYINSAGPNRADQMGRGQLGRAKRVLGP